MALEPHPGDIGFGLHGDHLPVQRVAHDERFEKVAAVLRIGPPRRNFIDRLKEAGGRELANADRVDHRHVRPATLGDGANEDLMQILEVDDGDVQADLAAGGGTEHRLPRPLGHDHA